MGKIRITQTRSKIGQTVRQKRTLDALGLKRISHTVGLEATPQVLGMVSKISHLLSIEEVK